MSVITMPVGEFLTRYEPAYGDTWRDAFAGMLADPGDVAVVDALTSEIATRGIESPVVVDPGEGQLCNGMHRVLAASLIGMETPIPVRESYPSHSDSVVVVMSARVPDAQDVLDTLMTGASFRLDESCWIEQVGLNVSGNHIIESAWCGPATGRVDQMAEAMKGWLAVLVPGSEVTKMVMWPSFDDWPDDAKRLNLN